MFDFLADKLIKKNNDLNAYIILKLIAGTLTCDDIYANSPEVSARTNLNLNYLATFLELVTKTALSNEWKMQLSWDRYIAYQ